MKKASRFVWFAWLCMLAVALPLTAQQKPNIVVIFGDDIGSWNVGAYTHGMMGRTPNIDRIAKEGVLLQTTTGSPVVRPDGPPLLWGNYRYGQV
jgi:arylsulfatase A-like enzyme